MKMGKNCCICKASFDGEAPAILTMGGYANPRYLCPECEGDFEDATTKRDIEAIAEAMDRIGEKLERANIDDKYVLDAIEDVLGEAKERAEAIKNGTYDFSIEDMPEESEEEEPEEEPELTEEEKLREAELERKQKIYDRLTNIFCIAVIIAVVGFIVYKAIDRFFL